MHPGNFPKGGKCHSVKFFKCGKVIEIFKSQFPHFFFFLNKFFSLPVFFQQEKNLYTFSYLFYFRTMARARNSLSTWTVFLYAVLLFALPFFASTAHADTDVESYGTGKYFDFCTTLTCWRSM